MTGRDLILYILANGLEDDPVFGNGRFIGFVTPADVAVKMNVGLATVHTWMDIGALDYVSFDGVRYIPANFEVKLVGAITV